MMNFAQPEPLTRAKRAQYVSLLRDGDHPTSGATLSKAEQHLKEVECQLQLHDRKIKEKIEEKMSAIRRIDAEILLLENQRQSWNIQQQKCKLYFSSIRKLPDDVLSLIFANFVQGTVRHTAPLRDLPRTSRILYVPALDLAQVCARWGTISKRSKSLWGTIFVDSPEWGQYSTDNTNAVKVNLARRVREIIAFSEEAPLDFCFCNDDNNGSWALDPVYTLPILQSFFEVSDRWRDVSLYIPAFYQGDLSNEIASIHGHIPLLRSLTISLDYDRRNRTPYNAFQIAPNLKHLYFYSPHFDAAYDAFPISQLKSAVSWNEPSAKYLAALSTSLDLLTIEVHLKSLQSSLLEGLAKCPAVQKLIIHSSSACAPEMWELDSLSIFDKFTLPALQELQVIASPGTDTIPNENFDSFLRRSKCTLTSLSLIDISFDSNDLIHLLRHSVPHLQTLHFAQLFPNEKKKEKAHYTSIDWRFFNELWVDGEARDVLLPKLTELSLILNTRIMDSSSWESLALGVSSRWRPSLAEEDGIACLKTLILHFPGAKWKEDRLDLLRTLAAAGMSVVVKDATGHLDI